MRRLLTLLSLLLFVAAAFWLTRGLAWQTVARHEAQLQAWVDAHPGQAAVAYLLAYTATAALSLPHAALMTAAGGLIFGPVVGTILTALGATAGSTLLLVVLRSALPNTLARHRSRIPDMLRRRLHRDGLSYLLFVRLLPVFPFWLVNIAAAVIGVRLSVFVPGTLFGVIPVSYAIASIGAGVGNELAAGHAPDLSAIFAPPILLPLIALAVLSVLPVLLRCGVRHA